MTAIGSSNPPYSPSRPSSPSLSHALLDNDMQAQLQEEAPQSRPHSLSLLSPHAPSNEENLWRTVIEERYAEIVRLPNENLGLAWERNGVVMPTLPAMEISSNLVQAEHQRLAQDNMQEFIASLSTGLLSGSSLPPSYYSISSSNLSEMSRDALERARHLSTNVQINDFLQSSLEDSRLNTTVHPPLGGAGALENSQSITTDGFFSGGVSRELTISLTPFILHSSCVLLLLQAKDNGWIDTEKNPWWNNVITCLILTWVLSLAFGLAYKDIAEGINRMYRREQRNAGDIA